MRKKRGMSKLDRFSIRATITVFWMAFLCVLLAAENFAHYRYDYVFRQYLPYVLPVLAGLAAVGLIVTLVLCFCRKRKEPERVINLPFVVCLLVPLVLTLGVPACVLRGVGLNIFKLTTELLFYFDIGYFVAFVLYYLRSPAAGARTLFATLCGLVPICYYVVYCSPSAPIMMSVQYAYLTPVAAAVVFALALFVVLVVLWILQKCKRRFHQPTWYVLVPFILSGITLFCLAFLPVTSDVFAAVAYGNLALQVVLLVITCLLKKTKK